MKRFIEAWRRPRPPESHAQPPADAGPADELPGVAQTLDASELCPLPARLELAGVTRVMALVPHPDDESIGCGGALARLSQAGVAVRVVLVSDGSGAGGLPPGAGLIRQQEFVAALGVLGVRDHAMLGFPDGGLKFDAALRQAIGREVAAFAPEWLLCPSGADLHRDHRVVWAAAREAALATPSVQRLCEYEVWAPLPLTHVLDIGSVLQAKLDALACHRTALACGNYLEASAGLSRYRGLLLGEPGPAAAEGYLCSDRSTGFGWGRGWGMPTGCVG